MNDHRARREPSFMQLRVFHAIMITGSATRAAKLLGITQPAASKMLGTLESETGLVLFVRENQRLRPTQEAERLQTTVERLYTTYGAVQRTIDTLRDSGDNEIQVATIPTQSAHFLPAAIRQLRKEQPAARVTVDILSNQDVIRRVQSGRADFGLIFNITPSPDLITEDFGRHQLVCIAPLGHRFCELDHVTADDLHDETFISFGQYTSFGLFLRTLLTDVGTPPVADVVVTSSATMMTLVQEGVGVGLVESAALRPALRGGLVIRAFRPKTTIRSRIVRSRIHPLSLRAKRLWDLCRRLARRRDDETLFVTGRMRG